jgi:hypothetical protein
MTEAPITRTLVPVERRMATIGKIFGADFPMKIEPYAFSTANMLSDTYKGGYWEFYTLSNGGFYMAPALEQPYLVESPSQFSGILHSDAFGIVCCLYAYSHLSFATQTKLSPLCATHYHALRDYALAHASAQLILKAID